MAFFQDGELDVSAYTVEDSFELAMAAAARDMEAPLPWNDWQRLAAAVRIAYPEVPMDIQAFAALRRVTMTDRFGADW